MKDKSNENGLKAVSLAIFISMFIYISLSLLGIYTFGSNIKHDLLDNVGENGYSWESIIISICFLLVIIFHIPFIFFVGKEAFLIVVDELDRRSISSLLDEQLTNIKDNSPTTSDSLSNNSFFIC